MGTGIPNPGIYLGYLLIINHTNGTQTCNKKHLFPTKSYKISLLLGRGH